MSAHGLRFPAGLARMLLVLAAAAFPARAAPGIDAGGDHALAVRSDGLAVAWGSDANGQLGQGAFLQSSVPFAIAGLADVAAVAPGERHVLALTRSGLVYAWGGNLLGQLGDGTRVDRVVPARVPSLANVVAIAAGPATSFAVQADGSLWAWGDNILGDLGIPGSAFSTDVPVRVSGLTGVVAVAVCPAHALALLQDGTVWGWGWNPDGAIGDGTREPRLTPVMAQGIAGVSAIACGTAHSLAVTSDGGVWSWGANDQGQLGDGTTTDRVLPARIPSLQGATKVAAGFSFSLALRGDGTVLAWGSNAFGTLGIGFTIPYVPRRTTPAPVPGLAGAAALAASQFQALALLANGTAVGWGDNAQGQLGDGTTTVRDAPVAVAGPAGIVALATFENLSFAVYADGTLRGFGSNASGRLAVAREESIAVPMPVPGLFGVTAVAAGYRYSLAAKSDGTVWAWGRNDSGNLGDGTETDRSTPVRVAGLTDVAAVAAGSNWSLALKRDGTVWAWGFGMNSFLRPDGTYSDGLTADRIPELSDIVAIESGLGHALALRRDGTVWAWGNNSRGELGRGVANFGGRVPQAVPGLANVVAIAAGLSQSFAVRADGTLWGWGANADCETCPSLLGDGGRADRYSPVRIPGVEGAVAVSTSLFGSHSFALLGDGTVMGWGYNYYGQLGDGTDIDRSTPVAATALRNIAEVDAGSDFSFVRYAGGGVLGWGYNYRGQAGDGTFATRDTPQVVVGPAGAGYLDLTPENPNGIQPERLPAFGLFATSRGPESAPVVNASVAFRPADVGSTGGVFVFAVAPASLVQRAAPVEPMVVGKARRRDRAKADGVACVLAQLNASGQLVGVSASTLQAAVSGVLSAQGQAVTVLNGIPTAQVAGTTFFVGYGANGQGMLDGGTNRSVLSVPGGTECKPQPPQTGWWWNPAEGGRGFSIETSGNRLFMAAYLYDVSGRASWLVSGGPTSLDGSLFTGRLLSVANGQTLAGAYRKPAPITDVGAVTMAFTDASHGTLVWPGGSIPIERFNIVPGGLAAAPQANQPESGWWWNAAEDGRGFFIEWQNGSVDLAGYMYDDAGNPIWYITVQPTPNPRAIGGNWWQYGGGQTLTGAYRPATRINDNVAPVTVQFSGPENAIMTLPGGRQLPLTRYRF